MRLLQSVLLGGSWASVALVQVTLVALLGWLAWLLARRCGPALRTAILLATLVGLLLAPAAASVAPVWLSLPEWACLPDAEPTAHTSDAGTAPPPSPPDNPTVFALLVSQPPAGEKADPEEPMKQAGQIELQVKAEAVVLDFAPPSEAALPPARPSAPPRPSWSPTGLLAALWLLGAAACLTRALMRLALLYYRSARARPIRGRAWNDCVDSLAQRQGLSAVALRESREIASPLTLGLLRPVILLPRRRRRWSAEQRVLILGHELAHVRRRDFLAGLLAEFAVCLCWFHPLVRWLAGQLRLEQEYAADAWVASAADDATDYVRCLARLALELDRGHGFLAPAFWRRRPEILRRIDMLRRNPKGLPTRLGTRAGWMVAMLAAAACLAVGGVGPCALPGTAKKRPRVFPRPRAKRPPTGMATLCQPERWPAWGRRGCGTGPRSRSSPLDQDGKTLLTAGRDNTIRLWDLATGKELRRFAPPKPIPVKRPERKNKVKIDQNEAVMQLMGGGGNNAGNSRIAVTADGKTLAASRGNAIQLWEVETGKELRLIQGPREGLAGLLFSPNGRTLAGRAFNGDLILWATGTGKELHRIKASQRPPRSDVVLAFGGGGGGATAPRMAFTTDSKSLAAAVTDYEQQKALRSIKFWDVASGKEMRKIQPPKGAGVAGMALAPDGKLVAYSSGYIVRLCAADTGREIRQLKTGGSVVGLVFVGDGQTLAVRGSNGRLRLWDTRTGKELRQLSDGELSRQTGFDLVLIGDDRVTPEVQPLALSSDGKRIAAGAGRTVRLWETASGKELPLLDGHQRAPSAIRVLPDGKTVVSWAADRVVRRWESATGKLLGAFPRRPEPRGRPSQETAGSSPWPTRTIPSAFTTRPRVKSCTSSRDIPMGAPRWPSRPMAKYWLRATARATESGFTMWRQAATCGKSSCGRSANLHREPC